MKLNCKEKIGIAVALGAMAIVIPMCCCRTKSPQKRFTEGGKEMLGAIPDMAKYYAFKLVKKMA